MKTEDHKRLVVARNVRALRKQRKWSQAKLAKTAGISSVSMIENGERLPRWETLVSIGEALGVEPNSFYSESPVEPQPKKDHGGGMTSALFEFLKSEEADGVTDEEIQWLVQARACSDSITPDAYRRLLVAYRVIQGQK